MERTLLPASRHLSEKVGRKNCGLEGALAGCSPLPLGVPGMGAREGPEGTPRACLISLDPIGGDCLRGTKRVKKLAAGTRMPGVASWS